MSASNCQQCGYDLSCLPDASGSRKCPECARINTPVAASRRCIRVRWLTLALLLTIGPVLLLWLVEHTLDGFGAAFIGGLIQSTHAFVIVGTMSGAIGAPFARRSIDLSRSHGVLSKPLLVDGLWLVSFIAMGAGAGLLAEVTLKEGGGC